MKDEKRAKTRRMVVTSMPPTKSMLDTPIDMTRRLSFSEAYALVKEVLPDSPIKQTQPKSILAPPSLQRSTEFAGVELVQELVVFTSPQQQIWHLQFSPDGNFLAVAGEDSVITVYEVSGFPLLSEMPLCQHATHTASITDINWLPSSLYLLSSSADSSVKLWKRGEPFEVQEFTHPHEVLAIAVWPSNHRYFLSICKDKVLRKWDIVTNDLEKRIEIEGEVNTLKYSRNGQVLLLGLKCGKVQVFDGNSLNLKAEISCRNRFGRFRKGRAVVGLQFLSATNVLVTTNDSRLRVVDLSTLQVVQKLKGTLNCKYPIQASGAANDVLCGSEHSKVYLWKLKESNRKLPIKLKSIDTLKVALEKSTVVAVFASAQVLSVVRRQKEVQHVILTAVKGRLQIFYNYPRT